MIRVSCEAEYLPIHLDRNLHSNTSLFRETFALGLSLTVSGDTPLSGLHTLVLVFICAFNDDMASSLNALRSTMAFSNDDNLRVHLYHTYGETLSSSSIVISNTAEILEDQLISHASFTEKIDCFVNICTQPPHIYRNHC